MIYYSVHKLQMFVRKNNVLEQILEISWRPVAKGRKGVNSCGVTAVVVELH